MSGRSFGAATRSVVKIMGRWGLCSLVALGACAGDSGPHLRSATPPAAPRNATVVLAGERLCGGGACATAAGEVQIGLEPPAVRAIVVAYSDTAAQIVNPPVTPLGKTALVVTVNERSSNALDFEVLP